jgi:hypothetical protein
MCGCAQRPPAFRTSAATAAALKIVGLTVIFGIAVSCARGPEGSGGIGRALEAFALQRDHRLGVAILAGRYDAANLPTARNARQVLSDAGHVVEYIEVAEGHNSTTWRDHLRDVLVRLLGDENARPGQTSR